MFFGMMAVFFWRGGERLRMLVTLLMGTIALEYVKDYVFMVLGLFSDVYYWGVMTITDMVAVPMYAFVLMELVRPGRLTVRRMLLHEVPFVLSALLYVATGWMPWVYAIVGWAVLHVLSRMDRDRDTALQPSPDGELLIYRECQSGLAARDSVHVLCDSRAVGT